MAYLLKRGKCFFENGDFDSAIEVFSHGVRMYPKYGTATRPLHLPVMPMRSLSPFSVAFYNNRSACFYKSGDLERALADATEAARLLTPAVKANAEERAKAQARAAAALAGLGRPEEALAALDAAVVCLPDHAGLRADRDRMRRELGDGSGSEASDSS